MYVVSIEDTEGLAPPRPSSAILIDTSGLLRFHFGSSSHDVSIEPLQY